MKKLIFALTFAFSSIIFAGDNIALYTTDTAEPKSASDIAETVREFTRDFPERNILFYVHGRSRTFDKEYESTIEMEKEYNVKVIMLRWNSWLTPITRPVENAKKASQLLNDSLNEFNRLKLEEPELFTDRKLIFLSHSMGNIVVKNYIESFSPAHLERNLFDSMILNGADVPLKGHSAWLSQVTFTPRLSVVVNKNDVVLKASMLTDFTNFNFLDYRLGLGFSFENIQVFEKLASPNATYFDLTEVNGIGHRHFVSEKPSIKYLFHYLLLETDGPLDLNYTKRKNIITILK